jgi:hypothetical protein
MQTTISGIQVPDSVLAREVTELVRDTVSALIFNHSSRVYYFGAIAARQRGLGFDPDLLYTGAMFHDMGLTQTHSSAHERFEVDGANAARDFLRRHGIAPSELDIVWTAIALHTTPGIAQHMHPVVALVTAGVEMDVLGLTHALYSEEERQAVVEAQAGHDLRQRESRRAGRQGPALCAREFLRRDPSLALGVVGRVSRRSRFATMPAAAFSGWLVPAARRTPRRSARRALLRPIRSVRVRPAPAPPASGAGYRAGRSA